jgi:hypothetical protein
MMQRIIFSFCLVFGILYFNYSFTQSLPDSTSVRHDITVLESQPLLDSLRIKTDTLLISLVPQLDSIGSKADTIIPMPFDPIELSPDAASSYIYNIINAENLWRPQGDTIKFSLSKLINHYFEPFDSISKRLMKFEYDSIKVETKEITSKETLPLKWLNSTSFIIDTIPLEKDPFIKQQTIIMRVLDSLALRSLDTLPSVIMRIDSLFQFTDTITKVLIDFEYLKAKGAKVYSYEKGRVVPSVLKNGESKSYRFSNDSSKLIITKSFKALVADEQSPFYIVPNKRMPDSLRVAVKTLIDYSINRDSILLQINDIAGHKTPLWLTSGKEDIFRYWVKNSKNDSITVWIGNPSRRNLTLALEEDINVERLERKMVDDVPFTTLKPDRSLARVKPLKEIPIYWSKLLTSAFSLNQNYLSKYWAKGGESSFSSMLDVNARTEYNNREAKTKWLSTGRLRYGTTWTDDHGFRTNTDIIEMNSQVNKVIIDKLDFSSGLYFKTQAAKGYNYPNDSVTVSKFLNPGAFTLGIGLEYKPNKKTSINFSPLSYRNTFVLDTANINQKAHGIDFDKRVRNEMGGQLVVRNSITILKDLNITNSVRLFSNYLKKPQNVDVDWEMSLEKQISWYFRVKLNFHLVYDDDILFPILGDDDKPILLPDGSEKRAPRAQFNQFLGLTFSFRIQ